MNEYEPVEVAIALALYAYNVSANDRVDAMHREAGRPLRVDHQFFQMVERMGHPSVVTKLDQRNADAYVRCAMMAYGEEARCRVQTNRQYQESRG